MYERYVKLLNTLTYYYIIFEMIIFTSTITIISNIVLIVLPIEHFILLLFNHNLYFDQINCIPER